ncbi:DUF2207 domain-containing protein [Bifidobacterium sp. ESL0763]|uniref:DUF2207 family protein n=1 Tax=Bifidobacterium sp. ESL0763 TaxID=2983227 RepID=UPI0023F6A84D|nr:DUF2207 domain-containing protein [Bifidobacterium sp. ESL0763]MDF7663380.1 DUF2207 domain-containing protein [Bifidobacterium sp. ESL0763]
MRSMSPRHVLNAILVSLVFTVIIGIPFLAVYLLGVKLGGDDDESDITNLDFQADLRDFLVILVLFTIVALGVVIYTNLSSRLPHDIEYSRDLPTISPGCATVFSDIIDPPPVAFSRVINIGSSAMAATLLALEEKRLIAIYPGVAADYEGFDLRDPDDAGLQGRMREVAEAQRSSAAATAARTEAQDAADGSGRSSRRKGRQGRHRAKRPAPMSGMWGRFLWNTSLGSKLRKNVYSQSWVGDVSQPSGLVSTICVMPMAFENPQAPNGLRNQDDPNGVNDPNGASGSAATNPLGALSSTDRAFLRFLTDFSRWRGSTVFDLNQLRAACCAEDAALGEQMRRRRESEDKEGRLVRTPKPVSFDSLFRGYRLQAGFFRAMRDELRDRKLVAYNMGPLLLLLLVMTAAVIFGAHPLEDLWDGNAGFLAIGLGALGSVIGVTMLFCSQPYSLSPEGRRAAIQLMGLKKYLRDFSDFSSRGAADVELWGQYLVYATALGLSEETRRQLSVYIYVYAVMEAYNYYGTDYEGIVMGGPTAPGASMPGTTANIRS